MIDNAVSARLSTTILCDICRISLDSDRLLLEEKIAQIRRVHLENNPIRFLCAHTGKIDNPQIIQKILSCSSSHFFTLCQQNRTLFIPLNEQERLCMPCFVRMLFLNQCFFCQTRLHFPLAQISESAVSNTASHAISNSILKTRQETFQIEGKILLFLIILCCTTQGIFSWLEVVSSREKIYLLVICNLCLEVSLITVLSLCMQHTFKKLNFIDQELQTHIETTQRVENIYGRNSPFVSGNAVNEAAQVE